MATTGRAVRDDAARASPAIITPDRRLRVFVSSMPNELADEREAAVRAITSLRMTPVLVALAARTHAPRDVSRSYVHNSDIFVAVYGAEYGDADHASGVSGPAEELSLAAGMPRLIYVKHVALRDPRLEALLDGIRANADLSYREFSSADELEQLLGDDLAVLLTERFSTAQSGSAAATPPTEESRPVPSLPVTPTSFLGRDDEVARVVALLRDPSVRLVTLVGPGGVGKTRLALEAGARAADAFPDGAVVVWLDALRDPAFLLPAIAAELRIKERAAQALHTAIAHHLADRRMLVMLDNFEHLISAAMDIAGLIGAPGRSSLLVTSRELLRIRGEHAVQLEPLTVPSSHDGSAAVTGKSEAVAMFVDRARAVSPGFTLTDDNAPAVAAIVERLEGLPLALELAAARVRLLPPGALLRRLERGLDLPGASGRDLPSRQRTLHDTIAWSYELLHDGERVALEDLSVFAGGASLDAAQQQLDTTPAEALELLDSLLRKSLIRRREDDDGDLRLELLGSIREFAQGKLAERGAADAARNRHADLILRFAQDTATRLHSAEQAQCLAAFDRELKNLQAALEWCAGSGRTDTARSLALCLRWYWLLRGHHSAADRWLRRLLELPDGSDHLRGQTLITEGMVALDTGDPQRAQRSFSEARTLLEAAGDEDGVAWARTGLGAALTVLGDFGAALELQEQALATFRAEEDLLGQCTANTRLALMAVANGDEGQAEERFHRSLAMRRRIGDPWGTGYVLTAIGMLRLLADDFEAARENFDEALVLVRRIDNRDGIARVLDGLGVIDAAHEDWDAAAERFADAASLYDDVGSRGAAANARAHLARAQVESSPAAAAVTAQRAFDEGIAAGDSAALACALEVLACVLAVTGGGEQGALLLGAAAGVRLRHRVPVSATHPLGPGRYRQVLDEQLGAAAVSDLVQRGRSLQPAEIRAAVDATRISETA